MLHSTELEEIPVKIRKNNLARRVTIRVRHGNVELVIPRRASMRRALKFLYSKENWVREKLAAQPERTKLEIGAVVPLFGIPHEITYGGMRGRTKISDGKIIIYGDALTANKKIKKFLQERFREEIEKLAREKAAIINYQYQKIAIRNNVSRWGSCSSSGTLSFCWRLIFAPHEITEYIVSHEVAHLKEMNHSRRFWAVVGQLCEHYQASEKWLKNNGSRLHAYI